MPRNKPLDSSWGVAWPPPSDPPNLSRAVDVRRPAFGVGGCRASGSCVFDGQLGSRPRYERKSNAADVYDADAYRSSDHDLLTYSWDFGDGTTGYRGGPSHTYAAGGTYAVTLTVSDDTATDTTSEAVTTARSGDVLVDTY